jgi:hypothetical protein
MMTDDRTAWLAARRAYELGRVRVGLGRASLVTCAVAVLTVACCGRSAVGWMPVVWLVWLAVEWRGCALRVGGLRGLVAGAVTLVLPTTWLRTCCAAMASGGHCAAPELCAVVGGAIGIAAAIALPAASSARRSIEAACGVALGTCAVSAARCTVLLKGEAIGLALGLGLGLTAASLARGWLARTETAAERR